MNGDTIIRSWRIGTRSGTRVVSCALEEPGGVGADPAPAPTPHATNGGTAARAARPMRGALVGIEVDDGGATGGFGSWHPS